MNKEKIIERPTVEELIKKEHENKNVKESHYSLQECPYCGYNRDICNTIDNILYDIDLDEFGGGAEDEIEITCSNCNKNYKLFLDISVRVDVETYTEPLEEEDGEEMFEDVEGQLKIEDIL